MASPPENPWNRLLQFSTIGLEMGLSVVLGLLIGNYLDRWLNTGPWMLVLFLLLGFAASIGADFAPGRYASMLGVIPIAFGMFGLVGLLRGAAPEGAVAPPTATGTIAVAGVTLANGSDSLAVFVSLLAETDDPFSYLVVGVAGLLALVWCGLAHWMVRHDTLGALLERVAPRILPFVLIAVGVYILLDTDTDTWLPAPGG